MLFRKRWGNVANFKREITLRTIPTECYQDDSDAGTPIKSQETILVCYQQCQSNSNGKNKKGNEMFPFFHFTLLSQNRRSFFSFSF